MRGLAAEGASFAYGSRPVLEGVDLEVPPGAVTVVVGPNGAGKTTLLRLLAGLLHPTAGRVLLDGREIARLPRRAFAREVALMPQLEPPAWPLTVEEMVTLGRAPHRGWLLPYTAEDRETVRRVMAEADLAGLAGRRVTELSGGELRRALFARTLAQEPRTVLLDEPTTHLDLKHQVDLLDRLQRLAHAAGVAVLATLHDLNQAAAYADRVALLDGGRLRAVGPPAEVLTPGRLATVYGLPVAVLSHPLTGRPWITAGAGEISTGSVSPAGSGGGRGAR